MSRTHSLKIKIFNTDDNRKITVVMILNALNTVNFQVKVHNGAFKYTYIYSETVNYTCFCIVGFFHRKGEI